MSDKNKNITVASSRVSSEISCESLSQTMRELDKKHVSNVFSLCTAFSGIKIIPDVLGSTVGSNEFAVIVGKELYKKLQRFKSDDQPKREGE